MNKLPLYDQLKNLSVGKTDFNMNKLTNTIQTISTRSDCTETLLIIHLLILHHFYISKETKTWGVKESPLVYQSKSLDNKGILYQLDKVPEEACKIVFELLRKVIVDF